MIAISLILAIDRREKTHNFNDLNRYYCTEMNYFMDIEFQKLRKQIKDETFNSFLNNLITLATYGHTKGTNYIRKTTNMGKKPLRYYAVQLFSSYRLRGKQFL